MALLSIEGVDIPTPSELNVGIQDLSKAERNAAGSMIIERIATKRKLELVWKYVTRVQLSQILNAVSPVMFSVTYMDPMTNAYRTGTFYAGDRTCGVLDFINGVPRYKDLKFSLIER